MDKKQRTMMNKKGKERKGKEKRKGKKEKEKGEKSRKIELAHNLNFISIRYTL